MSPRMEAFLGRKLERAREMGSDLVILQIDSPGGYLESSLNMAARMRLLDWARSVAYVPDEALSGAAIIALVCGSAASFPVLSLSWMIGLPLSFVLYIILRKAGVDRVAQESP